MSDKIKALMKDFIYYAKGGHLIRAQEIAREIELQLARDEQEDTDIIPNIATN